MRGTPTDHDKRRLLAKLNGEPPPPCRPIEKYSVVVRTVLTTGGTVAEALVSLPRPPFDLDSDPAAGLAP